ncbi:transglycosylase domain-containing protein [Bacteroidota bacterium]
MVQKKIKFRLYNRVFWSLFILIFVLVVFLFILVANGKFGVMPTFEELENPDNNIASEVYTEDNELIGTYYYQNRTYINFQDLSPDLVNALIATEDIRYTKHSGIDIRGLCRVVVRTILLQQSQSGGGSTITQQLAKNLFPRDSIIYMSKMKRSLNLGILKFKEWVTAVKLERNYTKEEIIVMYLNTVPFGSNTYGIKSAAKTYFNTTPDSLKLEEAALLIGMLKGQTWYSPVRNPERSLARRNIVISQMNKYKYISNEVFDSISILPIDLEYRIQDHQVGLATYFREYLRLTLGANKPKRRYYYSSSAYRADSIEWFNNPLYGWCNKNLKPDGTPYNLYRDGLKIYTTINSKMQKLAEDAVENHLSDYLQPAFFAEQENEENAPFADLTEEQVEDIMMLAMRRSERYRNLRVNNIPQEEIIEIFNNPVEMTVFTWQGEKDTLLSPFDSIKYYKHFFGASLMSIEPSTGHVRAYVGGSNFKHFKYDMVTQGKRQVGSTVKPFLYTLAMQEGYNPCYRVPNVPTTFIVNDTTWTPKNSGRSDYIGQMVTLQWGLAHSVNYISAWLMKQYNPYAIIDIMKKMGIKSYVAPVPSLFLGTSEITLQEMTSAFNTFANKGVYVSPIYISRIEDKNGNVIATFNGQKIEAISEETAYLMVNLLQGVVNRGTAIRLRTTYEFTNEIGGKTGTTQNHSDGWFIGITPELVTGVYVGAEDRSVHFRHIGMGQGARMAMPIWAEYMKNMYNDEELNFKQKGFDKPKNFDIELDCNKYEEEIEIEYQDYNDYLEDF